MITACDEAGFYARYRAAIGTDNEEQAYAELRAALRVNEPPPGWSVEEDIREEAIALGEHLAMRAVRC